VQLLSLQNTLNLFYAAPVDVFYQLFFGNLVVVVDTAATGLSSIPLQRFTYFLMV